MKISFKIENLYKGVDPYKVYDELQELGENVRPASIVERAKDTESELHKCFEWDDSKAAEKYRIHQARVLVGSLVIVENEQKEEPQQVRVMYTTKGGGYTPTKFIVQRKDDYEALLEKAMSELRAFKEKYSMLTELQEIFEKIS